MVKKISMFAVLMIATTSLMAFDDPIRRTVIVRDGNVVFDDGRPLSGKRAYVGVSLAEMTPELREFFAIGVRSGIGIGAEVVETSEEE